MATNPYLDLLQRGQSVNAEAGGNPYLDLLRQQRDGEQVRMGAAATLAQGANPDQVAAQRRTAQALGVPLAAVEAMPDEAERELQWRNLQRATAAAPVLRQQFASPDFAALAHDDSRALARLERGSYTFGRAFRKGVAGAKLTWDFLADNMAKAFGADRTETQRILQDTAGYYMAQGADPLLSAAGERAKEAGGGTWYGTLWHLPGEVATGDDPLGVVGRFFVEQLPASLAGFGLGVGITAPARAAITSTIKSELVRQGVNVSLAGAAGNSTAVVLQSLGVNYQEGLETGLSEPEAASRAWIKTSAEVPANALAGAAMGLRLGPNQFVNVLGQTGIQGAGGGTGAASAALAVGEEIDPVEIALEILGEAVTAGPELAGLSYARLRQARALQQAEAAAEAVEKADQLGELVQAADESALKARDPQIFAEFVQALQPEAVLYVEPQHLAELNLSAVPEIAVDVQRALADGGDVAVPLADLLAHLPGQQLLPHLRMQPDAMTAADAQAFDGQAELVQELATPADAQPAPQADGALLTAPEQAGMTPDAWAEYQQRAAETAQAALEQRDARSQRDLQWLANRKDEAMRALSREVEMLRSTLQTEALAEVRQQPVYAAAHWLKTGSLPDGTQTVGAKLNTAALREVFGDGPAAPWRYLPSNMLEAGDLAAGAGMHPDVVAEMFGFDSGDALVRALVAAQPEAEVVGALAEQRLLEQRPDIADAIARERSAEALVADRARTRFLATEAAALAQAVGNRVLLAQEARAYAERIIAGKAVRDARPAQFKAAAARAGRRADEAFRQGDTSLAAKWKQGQVLQSSLQDEASAAQAEVRQALRLFQRIARARDEGNRDAALANLARSVLQQYGLATSAKGADDYMAQVQRYDPDLHADLQLLLDGMPAPVADHRALTVADFRVLRDRVDAVWSLARSTREIEVEGRKVEIGQAATELAQQLAAEPAAQRDNLVGTNEKLDLRMRWAGVKAALRRVEFWADARDRGDKRGPFRRFIWNPISKAVTRYRAVRNERVRQFLDLLKPIEPTLKPGKIAAPELGDGMVFADRSALLHALLHTGNESNKRKLLLGYRWATEGENGAVDTSRWDAFLARMHREGRITAADWQFVQGTWDLLESMKPAAQEAHRRMFGLYFDEVTAEPGQTPFGELRGGYVPAITDNLLVPEARQHGAMDDLLAGQNSPMFPAVGRGFTKSRVEDYTRPLALDLRLLPAHIDKVARFSELGPVLRDTARLVVRNRDFRAAMDAVDPMAVESMLVPWLKRVSTQTLTKPPETAAGRAVAKIATAVRNRTGLLLMAGNVINTLQQATGFANAALRVKPRYLVAALVEVVRHPTHAGRAVAELSPWMAQRSETGARDVDAAISDMLTNPNVRQRAEQFNMRHGHVLQQAAQNFMDRVVWLGAFREAVAQGVETDQAVRDADAATRMTQSSFASEDASAVEHQIAFVRAFLQFFSYFNNQMNLIWTEASNAMSLPTRRAVAARLAMVYLLGFAVPSMMADLLAKGLRGDLDEADDDDELARLMFDVLFLSQARFAMSMIPVAGQAGNALLGQFTPELYDDRISASPAFSAVEATVRAPRSIYRAATGEGNPRMAVRDGLTAVGVLTGLPVGPLVRPLGHLADEDADVSLRGLITGVDPDR